MSARLSIIELSIPSFVPRLPVTNAAFPGMHPLMHILFFVDGIDQLISLLFSEIVDPCHYGAIDALAGAEASAWTCLRDATAAWRASEIDILGTARFEAWVFDAFSIGVGAEPAIRVIAFAYVACKCFAKAFATIAISTIDQTFFDTRRFID